MQKIVLIFSLLFMIGQNTDREFRNKVELENMFVSTISDSVRIALPADSLYVECSKDMYRIDGGHYIVEDVTCETYAVLKNSKLEPLVSAAFPKESTNTLLTTPLYDTDIVLQLQQIKYDFKFENCEMKLSSLLSSCIRDGFKPYAGISDMNDDIISATLFLVNASKGYNHILKLTIPVGVLSGNNKVITGTIHTFVPVANVKDYYAE